MTEREDSYISGNKTGGLKARDKNLAKNPNFYSDIGKLSHEGWVRNGRKPRGFAANPELAREAGRKAGRISKRGHKYIESRNGFDYYTLLKTGEVVKYARNKD